ncbi:MAG: hypothetical protein LBB63_02870 [Holosporaceae bacterium]|jgi:two-component system nitrogen regulation response regulator GlnG|nr:hypothetical protein [Holosporaceae bacterium]
MPNRDIIENLEIGFSKVLERYLEKYFSLHCGDSVPPGVYGRIFAEVEGSVLRVTMKHCNGNQMKASRILGINRNTLRKKIMKINSKEGDL